MNLQNALALAGELNSTIGHEVDQEQIIYNRGYRRGYIDGLQTALQVINPPQIWLPEPTCAECGSLLTSADVEAGETVCVDCSGY
jgi:hypothetical protein